MITRRTDLKTKRNGDFNPRWIYLDSLYNSYDTFEKLFLDLSKLHLDMKKFEDLKNRLDHLENLCKKIKIEEKEIENEKIL